MCSRNHRRTTLLLGAVLMAGSAATAAVAPLRTFQSRRTVLPRSSNVRLAPGRVTRPVGAIPGPGVVRPTGAIPGPGVSRGVGAIPGPGVTRPTGAVPGPGVTRPTGAVLGPGVTRPTGALLGPGVERPVGAVPGPGVTRPTGAIPGPGVSRGVGAIPGPGVARPTGAIPGPNVGRPTGVVPSDRDVVRPTGPTTGFTFRPLIQEPFRQGDRFPRNEALRAGAERTDLAAEELTPELDRRTDLLPGLRLDLLPAERRELLPAERTDLLPGRLDPRFDLLTGDPAPGREFRSDLLADDPAPPRSERRDLRADEPAPSGNERTDLRADQGAPDFFREAVPPVTDGDGGEIVGGTFTGGVVGTLYSWLLEDELAAWRLFDLSGYREDRFDVSRPLPRWSPLLDPSWKSSGQASVGPDWSPLREEQRWGASGRAGYGPDWSVLQGISK